MLDTLEIYKQLSETLDEQTSRSLASIFGRMFTELQNTVTRADFSELKGFVKDLVQAQQRTEEGLANLTVRVDNLAQAQQRTEKRLDELAQAQQRTEKGLQALIAEHKITRTQLGGLSDTVGYNLENEAFKALPDLLKRDYEIVVDGRIKRGYLRDARGRDLEVNVLGRGLKQGKPIEIIGESKVKLSKNDVDSFIRKRVKPISSIVENLFPILITHMITSPDVEGYARQKGIAVYYSYDF